jgi:hypothetical protein
MKLSKYPSDYILNVFISHNISLDILISGQCLSYIEMPIIMLPVFNGQIELNR